MKLEKETGTVTVQSNGQPITFNLSKMISANDDGKTLVYYFYKAGQFVGSSYLKMSLNMAANKLARNDTKGSLSRISTKVFPGKESEAESLLLDFMQDLFPHIEKIL